MTAILRDSVNPNGIPAGTTDVGGYVDGLYGLGTNYWNAAAWARWAATGARLRRIAAVTINTRSNTADVESQDLTPAQAPIWWHTMTALGETDLWVYVNRSNGKAVEAALRGAGIGPSQVKLWVATLNGATVVNTWIDGSPITYPVAAVQYIDRGPYDESAVYETFGEAGGTITEDDMILYRGPIHPKTVALRAFAAGSYYHEPFSNLPPAGGVTAGAVYPVDGYCYSCSVWQSPDVSPAPGNQPGPDNVAWHVTTGGWVPDALLDTSALAGAPGATWPAGEPVAALYDPATGRYIPQDGSGAADDDSAYVTKTDLAAVEAKIPTKATTTLSA